MQQLIEYGVRYRFTDGEVVVHGPKESRQVAAEEAAYVDPEGFVQAELVQRTVSAWEADR